MNLSAEQKQDDTAALLDILTTAVLLLNEQLRLIYLNPAAENLFEISQRQVRGHCWSEVTPVSESMMDRLRMVLLEQQLSLIHI